MKTCSYCCSATTSIIHALQYLGPERQIPVLAFDVLKLDPRLACEFVINLGSYTKYYSCHFDRFRRLRFGTRSRLELAGILWARKYTPSDGRIFNEYPDVNSNGYNAVPGGYISEPNRVYCCSIMVIASRSESEIGNDSSAVIVPQHRNRQFCFNVVKFF